MTGAVAARLDGERLHLQHGPIDLIVGAEGPARDAAFRAAAARFATILDGLVAELPRHRSALHPDTPLPADPTACRMYRAARPFAAGTFVSPMIAVAGSVADEVLAAMLCAGRLDRAYVNNGGDIALHLGPGATYSVAMATVAGSDLGRVRLDAPSGVGGIATSGAGGRSLSLGIADSVTVLARSAAGADVAATLIANAVDLPGHPGVTRAPADTLQPDSDLAARAVVTAVGALLPDDRARALRSGLALAQRMQTAGQILGAALFLQGDSATTGSFFAPPKTLVEIEHA